MNSAKALFVSGTGTDIGKTYVTALIAKLLRNAGRDVGYYKAAVSGVTFDAAGNIESDATYVAKIAGIPETHEDMVSYTYRTAVSPHLAARLEGNPVDIEVVRSDFARACGRHDYVLVEGSGGIVCPLRRDNETHLDLDDVVRDLGLPVLLVADAGLGTLNALATTTAYLNSKGMHAVGIILNRFKPKDAMHEDNRIMAEELCGVPVVGCIPEGGTSLDADPSRLERMFAAPNGPGTGEENSAASRASSSMAGSSGSRCAISPILLRGAIAPSTPRGSWRTRL